MPQYLWTDENSGYNVEVYRHSHEDYQVPPEDSELPEEERGKERKWKKLISKGVKVAKGYSWGRGKGHW